MRLGGGASNPRTIGEGDVLGAVLSKTGEGTFGAKTMHPRGGDIQS